MACTGDIEECLIYGINLNVGSEPCVYLSQLCLGMGILGVVANHKGQVRAVFSCLIDVHPCFDAKLPPSLDFHM